MTRITDVLAGARRHDAHAAQDFADLLESGRTRPDNDLAPLVSLARALAPAEHRPEPTFRTALRAQLVAEAAARVPALPDQRAPERPSAPRWRSALAAVAMASAVSGVGAAAASSQALPGDPLYGLKLRVEAIQLSLADSDLERGRELFEQAEARLGEAERLAAAGSPSTMSSSDRDELSATLATMDAAATAGAAALVQSYEQTGDPEPMLLLSTSVANLRPRLQGLSAGLDQQLRARVLRTIDSLAALGTGADALLVPTASGTGEAAGSPGHARVDGRAASDPAGRGALPPSAADGGTARGSDRAGSTSSTGSTDSTGVRDGVDAASAGSVATGTSSSLPPVTAIPAGGAVTVEPLPDASVPVPSVAVSPEPSVTSPVVPAPPTSAGAPATVPAPAPCVAVPALTTC